MCVLGLLKWYVVVPQMIATMLSLDFSVEEMVLGGIIAAVVLVCLMTLGSILHRRLHKPTVLSCDNT